MVAHSHTPPGALALPGSQDIHWSLGKIGYFPSYTLGAIAAVQIYNAWEAEVGQEHSIELISSGRFEPLREWLREKIHQVRSG